MFDKKISAKERVRNNLLKKMAEQEAAGWGESHIDTGKTVVSGGRVYIIRRDGSYIRSKSKDVVTPE